jgi:uncharacterized protein
MKAAADLFQAPLLCLTTDSSKLRTLLAKDATWEFAYGASAGLPSSAAHGVDEIVTGLEGFLAQVEGVRFSAPKIYRVEDDDAVYRVEDDDAVFAECEAWMKVTRTGRDLHQNFIFYLRAEGGKVAFIREYFDPTRIVAAFS